MKENHGGSILPQPAAEAAPQHYVWLQIPLARLLIGSFPSSCTIQGEGNLHFLVRREMTSWLPFPVSF